MYIVLVPALIADRLTEAPIATFLTYTEAEKWVRKQGEGRITYLFHC